MRKTLSWLLTFSMVLSLFAAVPLLAGAVSNPGAYVFDISEGSITISDGTDAGTYKVTYGAGTPQPEEDNIPQTQIITLTGAGTANTITVSATTGTVRIKLAGMTASSMTLTNSDTRDVEIILQDETENVISSSLKNESGVTGGGLTIACGHHGEEGHICDDACGSLTASGGGAAPGIWGYNITINGGNISATSGFDAPGIGNWRDGKNITINGGRITSTGKNGAAGIGGSDIGSADGIYINGGIVNATGAGNSSGIGGGAYYFTGSGQAHNIIIDGGTVKATSGGAGIGGPKDCSNIQINGGSVNAKSISILPVNASGTNVYLTTVTLSGAGAWTQVSDLTITGADYFGKKDIFTDAAEKIYLYLPEESNVTGATAGGSDYEGSVTTTGDNAAAATFTLVDTTAPTYALTAPTSIAANGVTAAVTFSPASPVAVGTSVTATVTLTGEATAAGTHTVDLTSVKASLTTNPQTETVTVGQNLTTTPVTKTFTFTMPSEAVNDFVLTHSFAAASSVLFFEDFESYDEDDYPSSFTRKQGGSGAANQKVILAEGLDGATSKVFRLHCSGGYSSLQTAPLPNLLPGNIVIDGYIKPVSASGNAELSLYDPDIGSYGIRIASVWLSGDGKIMAVQDGDYNSLLQIGTYEAGSWYRVTLDCDIDSKTYDVYIDGAQAASDIPMHPSLPPVQMALIAQNNTPVEAYYDNVGIYSGLPDFSPVLDSAATNAAGNTVILTFDKVMADPAGKHNQFAVTAGGSANTVTAAALGIDTKTIELTLTTAITYGQTVTVSYTAGTVTASNGRVLASFTDQAVTNNVPESVALIIGSMEYPTLLGALTAAAGTDTIQLLKDVTYSNAIKATEKDVTIDLNGFDLTVSGVSEHALQAAGEHKLTITDAGENGGVVSVSSTGADKFAAYAASGGDIVIEGTLSANYPGGLSSQDIIGAFATGEGSAIRIVGDVSGYSAGIYSINSANITVIGDVVGSYWYGAYAAYNGSVDVTGNINGNYALNPQYGGIATVQGDITGTQTGISVTNNGYWSASRVTVTGNVTGTGGDAVDAGWAGVIEITGNINGSIFVHGAETSSPEITVNGDVTVSGGYGINIYYGGTVTVNGRILGASPYLSLDNLDIAENDFVVDGDYYKYTNQVYTSPPLAANTVYVAIPASHTVTIGTLSGGTITANPTSATPGAAISLTVTPASGKRLKAGTLKYNDGSTDTLINESTKSFTMPAANVTVTAEFEDVPAPPPPSGGGDTPTAPAYKADVKTGDNTETPIPVTVDEDTGNASADIGAGQLTPGGTVITMPSIPNVDTYTVGIPVPDLSTADTQGSLTVETSYGIITVPSNMLTGVEDVDGDKAQISIGEGDKSLLPESVKAAIGDKPLIQLTLSIDGKQTDWSNPNAPVTVSIPYTPTAAELENPESIVVWYIDGSGNVVTIPNGRYDAATGMVTFSTTHFSDYAVAYNKVSFNDVASAAWYGKAVSFIAARGITTGTGGGNYSPEAKLTRGEFIVLMMRAYGISPDANPTDNFSDAGNTWYTGYLAAAKRLGISAGVGDNIYAPNNHITRQEMFTLLYRTLRLLNALPNAATGNGLAGYADAADIASYAREAMQALVERGIVAGSGGRLDPLGTPNRAQMAQVLYNLLMK